MQRTQTVETCTQFVHDLCVKDMNTEEALGSESGKPIHNEPTVVTQDLQSSECCLSQLTTSHCSNYVSIFLTLLLG